MPTPPPTDGANDRVLREQAEGALASLVETASALVLEIDHLGDRPGGDARLRFRHSLDAAQQALRTIRMGASVAAVDGPVRDSILACIRQHGPMQFPQFLHWMRQRHPHVADATFRSEAAALTVDGFLDYSLQGWIKLVVEEGPHEA